MIPKKVLLTIFFFGLVVLVLVFLPIFLRDASKPTVAPTPTTIIPTPSLLPSPATNSLQAKRDAISQLPYTTGGFTIEYFPSTDYFFVQIRLNPYEQYETEVKNWFRVRGLNPDELNIQWGSVRGVVPRE